MKRLVINFIALSLLLTAGTVVSGCRSHRRSTASGEDASIQTPMPADSLIVDLTTKGKVPEPDLLDGQPRALTPKPLASPPSEPVVAPAEQPPAPAEPVAEPAKPVAPPAKSEPKPADPSRADAARIRPGLIVNVNVLVAGKMEIEATGKRVTDGGMIVMPLLGTVNVNNMALDEVSATLTAAYSEYYVKPLVIVEFIRDDRGEGLSPWGSVTILGRVKKPGKISIPATRDLTLSAAIQQAGGFDTSAKQRAIRITRRLPDKTLKTWEVDFHSVGAKGLIEDDIPLEADDVVFVPELVF